MSNLAQSYLECDYLLRAQDHDRWLASLFVPVPYRAHIQALYAFSLEVARIRENIREPLNGEIRLQYWRDVLDRAGQGESRANPVAHALLDTVEKFNLPVSVLHNLIDARVFDLYDDTMPSQHDLEGYCGETCSVLFQLGGLVLGGESTALVDAAGHGGVAYAMGGLMLALPVHLQRGQCYLPLDVLQKHALSRDELMQNPDRAKLKRVLSDMCELARGHLVAAQRAVKLLPPIVQGAFLPLSLVSLNLNAIGKNDNPAGQIAFVSPWRKQWALWRASRSA